MDDFGIAHNHGSAAERVWRCESLTVWRLCHEQIGSPLNNMFWIVAPHRCRGWANHTRNSPGPGQDPVPEFFLWSRHMGSRDPVEQPFPAAISASPAPSVPPAGRSRMLTITRLFTL